MTFSALIGKWYRYLLAKLHLLALPFLLVVSYLSAYWVGRLEAFQTISRAEVTSLHLLSGFLLSILCLILIYDLLHRGLVTLRRYVFGHAILPNQHFLHRNFSFKRLVDYLFYFCMVLICLLGYLLYLIRFRNVGFSLVHTNNLLFAHGLLAWLFLSLVCIKYYLTLTLWFKTLLTYLRKAR